MFLSHQIGFSLAKTTVGNAVLASISSLEPSSAITTPRYWSCITTCSLWLLTMIYDSTPLGQLVTNLVFSALIYIPYYDDVASKQSIRRTHSSLTSRPPMSFTKPRFEIGLPPMLTVPSRSSKASVIARKMLNCF